MVSERAQSTWGYQQRLAFLVDPRRRLTSHVCSPTDLSDNVFEDPVAVRPQKNSDLESWPLSDFTHTHRSLAGHFQRRTTLVCLQQLLNRGVFRVLCCLRSSRLGFGAFSRPIAYKTHLVTTKLNGLDSPRSHGSIGDFSGFLASPDLRRLFLTFAGPPATLPNLYFDVTRYFRHGFSIFSIVRHHLSHFGTRNSDLYLRSALSVLVLETVVRALVLPLLVLQSLVQVRFQLALSPLLRFATISVDFCDCLLSYLASISFLVE